MAIDSKSREKKLSMISSEEECQSWQVLYYLIMIEKSACIAYKAMVLKHGTLMGVEEKKIIG
jgi:hypothetical protein